MGSVCAVMSTRALSTVSACCVRAVFEATTSASVAA